MSIVMSMDSIVHSLGSVRFNGSWSGAGGCSDRPFVSFKWGYGSLTFFTPDQDFGGASAGEFSKIESVNKDRTIRVRSIGEGCDSVVDESVTLVSKTFADAPAFTGLFPGTPSQTECAVSGSVTPNIIESTGAINIQYRVQGTATWFDLPTLVNLAAGAGPTALSGTISGLNAGVSYEARYRLIRTTANGTTAYSNIGTFTTAGSTPITIGCPLIITEIEVFPPTAVAGGTTILAPLIETEVEVFVPSIVTSQRRVINMYVTFATSKTLTFTVG